jgi:hypothetical protein
MTLGGVVSFSKLEGMSLIFPQTMKEIVVIYLRVCLFGEKMRKRGEKRKVESK